MFHVEAWQPWTCYSDTVTGSYRVFFKVHQRPPSSFEESDLNYYCQCDERLKVT